MGQGIVPMIGYWLLLVAPFLIGLGLGDSPLVILSLCSLAPFFVISIFSFCFNLLSLLLIKKKKSWFSILYDGSYTTWLYIYIYILTSKIIHKIFSMYSIHDLYARWGMVIYIPCKGKKNWIISLTTSFGMYSHVMGMMHITETFSRWHNACGALYEVNIQF